MIMIVMIDDIPIVGNNLIVKNTSFNKSTLGLTSATKTSVAVNTTFSVSN